MVWRQNTGEVMATPTTDKAIFERTVEFAREINLQPFPVHKEVPGYVLNSLLIPWLDAAAGLYANEVANSEVIDKDWKVSTGSPKGPFEIYDIVGFNVAVNIARANPNASDAKKKFADLLEEPGINQGKAGLADGAGFDEYDENGNVERANPDWVLYE